MSHITEKEAHAKARELVKRLKGKGWKAEVWENLGWHWAARTDHWNVFPSYDGDEFTCLLGDGSSGKGLFHKTGEFYDKDPNKAVAKQLRYAKEALAEFVAEHQDIIDAAEKELLS